MRAADLFRRLLGRGKPTTAVARRSAYSGAQATRLTYDWVSTPTSVDRSLQYDLGKLRERARDLVRNQGYSGRFLAILCENVLGHRGITLDADIPNSRGGTNEPLSDAIEAAWKRWGHTENCSADGLLSWLDLQRLALRTLAQDGEYLIRIIRGADNPFSFALQILDPDLLDHEYRQMSGTAQNEVRMGIERDELGKPAWYWIWASHPQDVDFSRQYGKRIRVPAADILHGYLHLRPAQTRGITWFAPTLFNAQMLRGYAEAEVTAARVAAAKMGFLVPPADAGTAALPLDAPNNQQLTMDASPGSIDELPPGYTVQDWSPEHPGGQFSAFTKAMLREIASGLGVSYNALANDLESVNYSSMRAGMLPERDTWRALQMWLVEHLHRRVFAEWISLAVLSGQLPPSARAALKEGAVEWQPRGWPWVDPLKDIQAVELAISLGLDSRKATLAEEGREVEDVFAEIAAENALADKLEIKISGQASAPPVPAERPPGDIEDQPPADEDTEPDEGQPARAPGANGNGRGRGLVRRRVLEALAAIGRTR